MGAGVVIQQNDPTIEEIRVKEAVENRNVYLIEEIDRDSIFKTKYLVEKIVKLDRLKGISPSEANPLNIRISSYGGSVHSTLYFIGFMRSLQRAGYKIHTYIEEVAMSGGFFIAICGDKRFSYEYASILFHDPRDFAYGLRTTEDARRIAKEFEEEWSRLKKITLEYTNIDEEKLEWYVSRKEDWLMFPEEAKEYGIIDEIL